MRGGDANDSHLALAAAAFAGLYGLLALPVLWWQQPSLEGLLASAVLALALLVACRGLVLGTAIGKWDVEAAYAHEFTLLADYARSFQLLLWNPLCNGGSPEYLRDNGTLSPLNLLLAFVVGGKLMSFWQYWLALWLLGGVGMLCLARHLRAPAWGGVVVALGFLLLVGFILVAEAMGTPIPKGYLYFALGFAGLVQGLILWSQSSERHLEALAQRDEKKDHAA